MPTGLAAGATQHGDSAAVLRPARDVVADGNRALLAVGNCADAVGGNALRDEEVARSSCAASTKRQVVFAGTAFVGMTLDGDRVLGVTVQPLGLTGKRLLRVGADQRRVGIEEDAVTNIDREVLRRSGCCGTSPCTAEAKV